MGFTPQQLPGSIAGYLAQSLGEASVGARDMEQALLMFDEKVKELCNSKKKVDKLKPLKAQNKELLQIIRQEQAQRRFLQN